MSEKEINEPKMFAHVNVAESLNLDARVRRAALEVVIELAKKQLDVLK